MTQALNRLVLPLVPFKRQIFEESLSFWKVLRHPRREKCNEASYVRGKFRLAESPFPEEKLLIHAQSIQRFRNCVAMCSFSTHANIPGHAQYKQCNLKSERRPHCKDFVNHQLMHPKKQISEQPEVALSFHASPRIRG